MSMAEIKEVLPPPMKHRDPAMHAAKSDPRRLIEELPTGYKEFERR